MRASASPTAAVVMELKAGALLDLVDADRDWYKVRDPQSKKEGFVPVAAVELLPGPAAQGTGASARSRRPPAGRPLPAKPAAPPRAPKKGDWTDRGYFAVNGIDETGGSGFTQSQSWPSFAETATVNVEYPAKNSAGVDIQGGFRLWRNMAVGAGITAVSRSTTTTVTGSLPNPLYLNRPISLSGGFDAKNSQLGIHIQVAWVVPMPPKMQLVLFGGPSIFSVTQTIVESQGIGLSSAYPFESGSISSANTTDAKATAFGFGAGADFSYFFSRTIGVGGLVRFARATAAFPVSGQPDVEMDAGGFQVGAGLRVRIPSPKAAKPKPPATPKPRKPRRPRRSESGWMQAMATNDRVVDAVLVGGGVMSATVGALLQGTRTGWSIEVFERLDDISLESSHVYNNAGTGHAAFCELNYTPQRPDGSVDVSKALKINELFQVSRQFWATWCHGATSRRPGSSSTRCRTSASCAATRTWRSCSGGARRCATTRCSRGWSIRGTTASWPSGCRW